MNNYFKISEFFPNIDILDQLKLQNRMDVTNKILKWWRIMNDIRTTFNYPIRITSTWRTLEKNKRIGGAKNSQHLTFDAVDFVPANAKTLDEHLRAEEIYRNMCRATILETNRRMYIIGQIIFYPYKYQIHIANCNGKYNMRTLWIAHADTGVHPLRANSEDERDIKFYNKVLNNLDLIE